MNYLTAISQYYYKDLVTTKQINETFRIYKTNKITRVALRSFQENVAVTEGFEGGQKVNLTKNQVETYTKTADRGESLLTAYYNSQGLLIKTIDSTEETAGTTAYEYDTNQRLLKLTNETHAADMSSATTEIHFWQYTTTGNPNRMIRVKNGADTTIINFITDAKGNVIEEEAMGKEIPHGKVYYYYDEKDRLTDVVRYNIKAKRLLPDYIFEYDENEQLSTMTIVPEGSNEYLKWYYEYDEAGLKLIEFCYNKRNEIMGKIEYNYSTGR